MSTGFRVVAAAGEILSAALIIAGGISAYGFLHFA